MIIDNVHLLVQAGNGGNGCESYYMRADKKRIPHGADGGDGGSIIIRATEKAPYISNLRFKQHFVGNSGEHGKSSRKRGRNGEDSIILVPPGTRIYDREKNLLIRELKEEGEEVVVVPGGKGGSGNCGGKTASLGEISKKLDIEIKIQIRADVFILGLPNSGKSTFLNLLTRADVRHEDFPFATRSPEIGVWKYSDYEQMTLCEMPSLYQGSHEGRGMGSKFLRHLEAAKVVMWMIDPISEFAHSLEEGLAILKKEVEIFSADFLSIPSVLVINKCDLPGAKEKIDSENWDPGMPAFVVSSTTGEGMEALKIFLEKRVTGR